MWIISDEAMEKLLGGNYKSVVGLKKKDKDISVLRLYRYQTTYKTYQGFRKFYNKLLSNIIDGICYVNNNSIGCKVIRFLYEKK